MNNYLLRAPLVTLIYTKAENEVIALSALSGLSLTSVGCDNEMEDPNWSSGVPIEKSEFSSHLETNMLLMCTCLLEL